jgi:3-phenylpropionate/trans-cinnamate dioxygenase ferredoxin subunit
MSRQIPVGAVDELAPGQRKLAFVDGRSIVLFNIAGTVHAIDNACPHNGASLASGRLDGCMLSCPAHGLRFDLRTGRMPGAGGLSLTTFPVRAIGGKLLVSLEDPVTSTTVQETGMRRRITTRTDSDVVTTQFHSSNKP